MFLIAHIPSPPLANAQSQADLSNPHLHQHSAAESCDHGPQTYPANVMHRSLAQVVHQSCRSPLEHIPFPLTAPPPFQRHRPGRVPSSRPVYCILFWIRRCTWHRYSTYDAPAVERSSTSPVKNCTSAASPCTRKHAAETVSRRGSNTRDQGQHRCLGCMLLVTSGAEACLLRHS